MTIIICSPLMDLCWTNQVSFCKIIETKEYKEPCHGKCVKKWRNSIERLSNACLPLPFVTLFQYMAISNQLVGFMRIIGNNTFFEELCNVLY